MALLFEQFLLVQHGADGVDPVLVVVPMGSHVCLYRCVDPPGLISSFARERGTRIICHQTTRGHGEFFCVRPVNKEEGNIVSSSALHPFGRTTAVKAAKGPKGCGKTGRMAFLLNRELHGKKGREEEEEKVPLMVLWWWADLLRGLVATQ